MCWAAASSSFLEFLGEELVKLRIRWIAAMNPEALPQNCFLGGLGCCCCMRFSLHAEVDAFVLDLVANVLEYQHTGTSQLLLGCAAS